MWVPVPVAVLDGITTVTSGSYTPISNVPELSYDANSSFVHDILGYDNAAEFGEHMQKDYDDMVKSVQSHVGFYVGRYETGIEGSN